MKLQHQNDKILIVALLGIAVLVGTDIACKPPPPSTVPDAAALAQCVETQLEAGATNVLDIAAKCGTQDIALVEDIVQMLEKAQTAPTFAIRKAPVPASSTR